MRRNLGSEGSASPAQSSGGMRLYVVLRGLMGTVGSRRELPHVKIHLSMCLHRCLIQNGTEMWKMTYKTRTNVSTWGVLYRFGLPNLEVIAYTWVVTTASPEGPVPVEFPDWWRN